MKSKLYQRLFTLLLGLVMFLPTGVQVSAASPSFAGGDGSSGNPFQIADWHHLNSVRNNLTSHFILMNNLDEATPGYAGLASSDAHGGAGWQPIGYDAARFTGNFNGQGFEIRGLFINRPAEDEVGLFGVVEGGVIRNVSVVNASVTGRTFVGGLVGRGWHGSTIANTHSSGSMIGTENEVGGLVGSNIGTITNSYSTAIVSGVHHLGGLVGVNWHGTITNSYATGSVSGTGDEVGGLVGRNTAGTVTNSYATGSVSGTLSMVGGLVGLNYGGTVTNSYSTGSVSGHSSVGGLVGFNYGGTVTHSFWNTQTSGQASSDGGTGMATAEMSNITSFTGVTPAWDIVAVNPGESNATPIWNIVDGVTHPFLSWQPLIYNLSISSTSGGNVIKPGEGAFTFASTVVSLEATPGVGYGFVSWTGDVGTIADVNAASTTIRMDGDYTVTANFATAYNLTMAVSPAGAGSTTPVGTTAVGLGAVVSITAVANPGFRFVSWSAPTGNINDVNAPTTSFTMPTQDVVVTANFEFMFAGGDGSAADPLQITDWHQLNSVRYNLSSHFILMNDLDETTLGYADLASSDANAGAGWLPIGDWTTSFTGDFNGQGNEVLDLVINRTDEWNLALFGFVGEDGLIGDVGVVNVNVTGSEIVGGLVGTNYGTVTNSYSSGSVTGDWEVGGLVGQNNGTVFNSYFTGNVYGSEFVGGLVGQHRGSVANSYSAGSVSGNWTTGGLVGQNSGTVTNSYSTASVTGDWTSGGLAGANMGIIEGSFNSGPVTGSGGVGGVVGDNFEGTVTKSYNSGTVTGGDGVGGVVGYNEGTVTNSYNSGMVTGFDGVGGVIGYNSGIVTNSYNSGSVLGNELVGGLVGESQTGSTITNSYSVGSVSGSGVRVGGVVGFSLFGTTITNSYFFEGTAERGIGEEEVEGAGVATSKTQAQFTSGEVAWLLQGIQEDLAWGNTVLSGGEFPRLAFESPEVKQVFRVSFESQEPAHQSVGYLLSGDLIDFPDLERTGHIVIWEDIVGDEYPVGSLIFSDLELTARWEVNQHTLADEPVEQLFRVFPNPVTDILNIELRGSDRAELEIVSAKGVVVLRKTVNSNSNQVDVSQLPYGFYILRIVSGNSVSSVKFIRQGR